MNIVLRQLVVRTKRSTERVDFGEKVTFIYGPVSTGKSTVANALDPGALAMIVVCVATVDPPLTFIWAAAFSPMSNCRFTSRAAPFWTVTVP